MTGRRVLVAGAGMSGLAVATALLDRGAAVTVTDRKRTEATDRLAGMGAEVVVTDQPTLPDGVDEVVVSPGWRPDHPMLMSAARQGIGVYSEPELAWRLRPTGPDGRAVPWLAVTGTNGKTTTVTMLAAVLTAGGRRARAVGNIGRPLLDAVLAAEDEVLAVELSSFQLHWSTTLAPAAGVVLNLADDHLDWHGGFAPYAAAKALVWRSAANGDGVAVGNADDPRVAELLTAVPGRQVTVTMGEPGPGQVGVIDGTLVDRAFDDTGRLLVAPHAGTGLAAVAHVPLPGRHNVVNALAAATLARAYGIPATAVAAGLRGYVAEPHRNQVVATAGGVRYVDDSKATNPHAALASLTAFDRVVWVAGGLLKGVDVDDLVRTAAPRLAGAVLLGAERDRIAAALARHAPEVPVVDVSRTDDGAMGEVVAAAARLASPGVTVLLAPAAASMDMFTDFGHRGDAFADAVRAHVGER